GRGRGPRAPECRASVSRRREIQLERCRGRAAPQFPLQSGAARARRPPKELVPVRILGFLERLVWTFPPQVDAGPGPLRCREKRARDRWQSPRWESGSFLGADKLGRALHTRTGCRGEHKKRFQWRVECVS